MHFLSNNTTTYVCAYTCMCVHICTYLRMCIHNISIWPDQQGQSGIHYNEAWVSHGGKIKKRTQWVSYATPVWACVSMYEHAWEVNTREVCEHVLRQYNMKPDHKWRKYRMHRDSSKVCVGSTSWNLDNQLEREGNLKTWSQMEERQWYVHGFHLCYNIIAIAHHKWRKEWNAETFKGLISTYVRMWVSSWSFYASNTLDSNLKRHKMQRLLLLRMLQQHSNRLGSNLKHYHT